MKKILYKKYIQWQNDADGRKIKGTDCWSDFDNVGYLHSFVLATPDCPTYTIAIVIAADGLVHELHTNRIKFINLSEPK